MAGFSGSVSGPGHPRVGSFRASPFPARLVSFGGVIGSTNQSDSGPQLE